ncbi:MAG: arsenite S-adenosylmethyltransferase, partial [Alphaproteobacteria bacterium]|nr:arsenite S-adenosylmethyltransferase [Alphaproteobacteria bacterium]
QIRKNVLLWAGCVAGALQDTEYTAKLKAAGFADIGIEPTRICKAEDAREWLKELGIDFETVAPYVDGKFVSAFVRATKPRG